MHIQANERRNPREKNSIFQQPHATIAAVETDLLDRLSPITLLLQRTVEDYLALHLNGPIGAGVNSRRDGVRLPDLAQAPPKRIAEIVDDLLAGKLADGLSKRYLETLRSHLHRFAAVVDVGIESVTNADIETWLRSLNIGPRARNNIRASIVTLFRFARQRGLLP